MLVIDCHMKHINAPVLQYIQRLHRTKIRTALPFMLKLNQLAFLKQFLAF